VNIEPETDIYRFGAFEVDPVNRQFRRENEAVNLPARSFDLLVALIENRGRLVGKDELFENVWHGQIVEESNLTVHISQIRKALGESAQNPRYIETVPGYGYRFIGELIEAEEDEYVIETQTLSRITLEKDGEEMAEALSGLSIPQSGSLKDVRPLALPTKKRSKGFSRGFIIAAGVVVTAILALGIFFFTKRSTSDRTQPGNVGRFANVNIKRLTNRGTINWATISPDGKFFAYTANSDKNDFKLALWLAQTDGSNDVQVRPPEPGIFRGLAFSHDSRTLYFAHNTRDQSYTGTLYRIPVLGGLPEKILDNVGEFLSLSPDDREIAFFRTSDDKARSTLVIAQLDGSGEREVTSRKFKTGFSSQAPAWSPDGSTLAAAALDDDRNEEIYLINVNDGNTKQITSSGWRDIVNMAWLSDIRSLIVIAKASGSADNQLWQVNAADGSSTKISRDADTYGFPLSLSADSSSMLVTQGLTESNIWVAPTDNLADSNQLTFSSIGSIYGWLGLDWAPDGRLFFIGAKDQSRVIYAMDTNGDDLRQITPDGFIDQRLDVAPDGTFIVFQSNRSGSNEIWRVAADGSDLRQLTTGGANGSPAISPDGRSVLYVSGRYGKTSIWRIPAEGGDPVRITDRPSFSPRISPDGTLIACFFDSDEKDLHRLVLLPFAGGEPVKSFPVARSANLSLEWTPDGKAVSYRDWVSGVWIQPVQGGEARKLPGLPETEILPFAWSHDGRRFAFTRGRTISDAILITDLK
jgi:Tol biopolymer transport system component/DNA-binding winged helix-turn-helix (wHTH) protein